MAETSRFDLAIIGGGVNGCGIARDAAGRGLSVFLCEQGDLASATSSASTKLIHGGLRYLEYYKFRLVRESLIEREILLRAMPHIAWPLRLVLPYHKGLRPAWLLRLGLFIYDHLGGRKILPGTKTINLRTSLIGAPLKDKFRKAFEFSDCWVQDSRLVVLNARDAAEQGAEIAVRSRCLAAERTDGHWCLTIEDTETGRQTEIRARGLVNAAGPWVGDVIRNCVRFNTADRIRLVRGSHIVIKRHFDHDRAYMFQNADDRVIFAIPYEDDFTLIGTTDEDHGEQPTKPHCTPQEADYLRHAASEYFRIPIAADDVVWTYSGVRPLYDDGAKSASAATRDYVLKLDDQAGAAPLLNVFGGKITTFRRLAETVLAMLKPYYPKMSGPWTAGAALPGGDFAVSAVAQTCAELGENYPFLDQHWARRLIRTYGTEAGVWLAGAKSAADLGENFGFNLTAAEVGWLMQREWARTAEDVLWRRTKLGLRLGHDQAAHLDRWMHNGAAAKAVQAGQ